MTDDHDKEATRIIARPGPKQLPFRVEPPLADKPWQAAKPEQRPEPEAQPARPAVIVPPVGRPAVMLPPGSPARVGRSPLVAPPVVALPGAPAPVAAAPAVTPVTPPPAAAAVVPPPVPAAAVEPVVGWLVVVRGPGRGAALALHGGRNALGSAPGQDLRLAFGDPAVAPTGHAFLVYDEEARGFFIEDGKKKDLVRLNGRLLTETRPLASGDEIRIGATGMRFVAFCGPDFDWSAADAASAPAPAAPAGEGEGI